MGSKTAAIKVVVIDCLRSSEKYYIRHFAGHWITLGHISEIYDKISYRKFPTFFKEIDLFSICHSFSAFSFFIVFS